MSDFHKPALDGIPETMLWTLHNRATEALRSDGIINDEKAVEIYRSLDYAYEQHFGKAEPSHALRSIRFDREIAAFLRTHPNGIIVNLGEGLETQRFRIDEARGRWLSIDLPEAVEIRERFMQPDEDHAHIPLSALDRAWFDAVPRDAPVFITAQGLFMYFEADVIRALLKDIFDTFNHCYLMFDTIPVWFSKKTTSEKGWGRTKKYITPRMPWGINRDDIPATLKDWLTHDITVIDIGYPMFPRGVTKWLFRFFSSTPALKKIMPTIVKVSLSSNKYPYGHE